MCDHKANSCSSIFIIIDPNKTKTIKSKSDANKMATERISRNALPNLISNPVTTFKTAVLSMPPHFSSTTNKSVNSASISSQQQQQSKTVKKEKTKRRNSEKRKEKSRKAARERRSQEAKIFDEIEEILPVPAKILDHLDKASLVRVAINYLKIRSVVEPFKIPNSLDTFDQTEASCLNTLNGFVIVLSKDGDMIYLSNNVERFLGLNQIDLMGQSIYDYSHPCDHDDIKSFLEPLNIAFNASKQQQNLNSNTVSSGTENIASQLNQSANQKLMQQKNLISTEPLVLMSESYGPYFIRMKCTLTSKGRNLNLKSADYKVIKCQGKMIDLEIVNPEHAKMIGENYRHYMVAVAELIQNPIRMEIPLKSDVFISKHSPDMKFSYVDESVKELFGYDVNDLIGTSFYQYFDASDFNQLNILFKTLFTKGQCNFGQYKFLAKQGGYRWISSEATIINESNSNQPQSIILTHRVISNIQESHLLTSDVQSSVITINKNCSTIVPSENLINAPTPLLNCSAISTTTKVLKAKPIVERKSNLSKISSSSSSVPKISHQFEIKQEQEEIPIKQLICQPKSITEQFISSTETVLAPKTADMESGFLVFTDDNKGLTVLNDADDLTHLAPDAGDLYVPMLPDMDFADMSIFDEIFLNSTSFNISTSGVLSEDEFLASLDHDKLKLDNVDNFGNLDKFSNEHILGVNSKELKANGFDQYSYPLDANSNDPFLSFTNANNVNDEFIISDTLTTKSSECSMKDSFSSTSPMNSSSSSSSLQYSPKSLSCDETSKLCDNDDKDLEMRAPFIPIDDDYLLNDLPYSNLDDLFDWISNNDNGNINSYLQSNNINNKPNNADHLPFNSNPKLQLQDLNVKNKNSISKLNGGCLEALLQNDELICIKNKMYSSNQILNRNNELQQQQAQLEKEEKMDSVNSNNNNDNSDQQENNKETQNISLSALFANNKSASMKRKNSNIFVYTTMSNTGEKKIKNLILTPEIPANKMIGSNLNGNGTTSIHHFVLTKNNELIPRVAFLNGNIQQQQTTSTPLQNTVQQQSLKGVITPQAQQRSQQQQQMTPGLVSPSTLNLNEPIKDNGVFKKPRSDSSSTKNFSSNSVLLNLLVNGSDLSNGYELTNASSSSLYNQNHGNINHHQQSTMDNCKKPPELVSNHCMLITQGSSTLTNRQQHSTTKLIENHL